MSTIEKVIMVDDLDGSEGSQKTIQTVPFMLDGTEWAIDLKLSNADKLRKALGEYIEHARKVTGPKKVTRRPAVRADNDEIRTWARSHGIKVNSHGRIAASVIAQYEQAKAAELAVTTVKANGRQGRKAKVTARK